MTAATQVQILHTTINLPFDKAYEFAWHPENFPKWASGLSKSLHREGDKWIAPTPAGDAVVEFSERNDHGVLDHHVHIKDTPVIYIPLRMIANGDATEVELVLFRQPEMDDAAFAKDAATVKGDLAALKKLLETEQ